MSTLVVLGALSYWFISNFIFESVQVSGNSMYPTLHNAGNYWLNRYALIVGEPKRGDIVAAKDPQDGGLIVKRIIALPGDSIYLYRGEVYLNGKLLNEPYLLPLTPSYAYEKNESEYFCCGKDQYFVMGDNRNNSCDSRTFGPLPRADILGKVVE
ncbi:MAG TPA: signal peptidase I [Verrucomicrobiae bacterium]|nr:signal peptidase I [Verrucomicrobiae bacterium]